MPEQLINASFMLHIISFSICDAQLFDTMLLHTPSFSQETAARHICTMLMMMIPSLGLSTCVIITLECATKGGACHASTR
jgi:hypothetical protein